MSRINSPVKNSDEFESFVGIDTLIEYLQVPKKQYIDEVIAKLIRLTLSFLFFRQAQDKLAQDKLLRMTLFCLKINYI
jgi:hypothetical protein